MSCNMCKVKIEEHFILFSMHVLVWKDNFLDLREFVRTFDNCWTELVGISKVSYVIISKLVLKLELALRK